VETRPESAVSKRQLIPITEERVEGLQIKRREETNSGRGFVGSYLTAVSTLQAGFHASIQIRITYAQFSTLSASLGAELAGFFMRP
jgi:hypothetical protein